MRTTSSVLASPQPAQTSPASPPILQHGKRSWKKPVLVGLGSLLVTVLLIAHLLTSVGLYFARASIPPESGSLRLPGLLYPVTVVYDRQGVPYVSAADDHDLAEAAGYLEASDGRLLTMEVTAWVAEGTASAHLGSSFVGIDAFTRRLGVAQTSTAAIAYMRAHAMQTTALGRIYAETMTDLDAYARGVNVCIQQCHMPVEATLGEIRFDAWTPARSDELARMFVLSFSDATYKLDAAQLLTKLGPTLTNALIPPYPASTPTVLLNPTTQASILYPNTTISAVAQTLLAVSGKTTNPWQTAPTLPTLSPSLSTASHESNASNASNDAQVGVQTPSLPALVASLLPAHPRNATEAARIALVTNALAPKWGSNNWVVSGQWTPSGAPLLANDPHVDINTLPQNWYLIGLHSPDMNAVGMAYPGVPGIVIGQNATYAWGATVPFASTDDLYYITLDPKRHPGQYLYAGHWLPYVQRQETIAVQGGAAQTISLDITNHGAIMNSPTVLASLGATLDWSQLPPVAWQSTAYGLYADVTGASAAPSAAAVMGSPVLLDALDHATSWADFNTICDHITLPLNLVYADATGAHTEAGKTVIGNIGWRLTGVLPQRGNPEGEMVALDGANPANDWRGVVPASQMPRLFDPLGGMIVTANNQLYPTGSPYQLGAYSDVGYRAQRISELLRVATHAGPITSATFARMQTDVVSDPAATLTSTLIADAQRITGAQGTDAARAAHLLSGWTGAEPTTSQPASPFETWLGIITRQTVQAHTGDGRLYSAWLDLNSEGASANALLIQAMTVPSVAQALYGGQAQMQQAWGAALAQAYHQLAANHHGAIPTWGAIHQLQAAESVAASLPAPLASHYAAPAIPVPGDGETIWEGGDQGIFLDPSQFTYAQSLGPSYRQIIDLSPSARDASRWVLPGGESGIPWSPHFIDQLGAWAQGQYYPMPLTPQGVRRVAVPGRLLTLHP